MFKRRKPLSTARKVRDFFYPRSGFRRGLQYLAHRLRRLPDTPHKIAVGFSAGVFVSFSPFFGLHFIYAGICAMVVRGNVLASFLGTFVGNPLTFPVIATISLGLGRKFLGITAGDEDFVSVKDSFIAAFSGLWDSFLSFFGLADPAWDRLSVFWNELFVPYYIGGIIPGFVVAFGAYFLTRPLIAVYQARRRSKLLAKAKQKLAEKKARAELAHKASGTS